MTNKTPLRKMLKAAIVASAQFSQGFGKPVGEDFAGFCKEVLRSDTVAAQMIAGVMGVYQHSPVILQMATAAAIQEGEPGKLGEVISALPSLFKSQLELLYWGVKVGQLYADADLALDKTPKTEQSSKAADEVDFLKKLFNLPIAEAPETSENPPADKAE